MAYYAHVRNGVIEGVGTCFAVALDMDNIEISEDLYTKYIADKDGQFCLLKPKNKTKAQKKESKK